jgi:hypothetical protein
VFEPTRHFQEEVLRLLRDDHNRIVKIEQLLASPTLTAMQLGAPMAIGSIAPGTTGQFAVVFNFPAGTSAPAGFPTNLTSSSPDPLITFAPATTDASGGTIPLSQQVVLSVPTGDTNTTGQMGFTCTGTDGVTTLTSNVVSFAIPQPGTSATEPTLVASQLA